MVDARSMAKRWVKSLRNSIHDPWPRSHALVLAQIRINGARVDFDYRAKGEDYVMSMTLPTSMADPLRLNAGPAMDQLLTAIGVAFSAFFFKLSDFGELAVETAPLDRESQVFFEDFLVGGLGEFRYLQGLNPARKIMVRARPSAAITPIQFDAEDRVLMLNGGGKDTVVAAELLKASGQPFTWVTIRPNAARRKVIELSGVPDAFEVGYDIDDKIDRRKAYPWGHIPHTSIVLSIGLLVAVLTRARYVAAGNELSANHGNLRYRGLEVNHQYTKSSAFEEAFWRFAQQRVTRSADVFSILRPFHDLQLAQLFAGQKRYLKSFISCNRGIGRGEWCKQCPKCAFTALALRPFVEAQDLFDVFGEDVFQRVEIRKHILDLVSGTIKPWECVGTKDECRLGLGLLLEQSPQMDFATYPRRRDFERVLAGVDIGALQTEILGSTSRNHLIPYDLLRRLDVGLRKMSDNGLTIRPAQARQVTAIA